MKILNVVVFAFFALLLVAVRAIPLTEPRLDIEVIALEEGCVRQGGICVHTDDCDPNNQVHKGDLLCPAQRHLGVTCCYV
uniref:Single domain-containing protein n=1 Tax=Heliothis virescens TaxID=7102 RepID=A0A2A4JVR2_HELVI